MCSLWALSESEFCLRPGRRKSLQDHRGNERAHSLQMVFFSDGEGWITVCKNERERKCTHTHTQTSIHINSLISYLPKLYIHFVWKQTKTTHFQLTFCLLLSPKGLRHVCYYCMFADLLWSVRQVDMQVMFYSFYSHNWKKWKWWNFIITCFLRPYSSNWGQKWLKDNMLGSSWRRTMNFRQAETPKLTRVISTAYFSASIT